MEELEFYPFNSSNMVLREDNMAIVRHDSLGHLCGYVAFPAKDIPKKWHGTYNADALQYLNIHGGLTFAKKPNDDWVVFGFDCAHSGDEDNASLKDPEYVMDLTRQMEQQLIDYAAIIKKWRKANRGKRMEMVDEIRDKGKHSEEIGFGALLGALWGATEFGDEEEE